MTEKPFKSFKEISETWDEPSLKTPDYKMQALVQAFLRGEFNGESESHVFTVQALENESGQEDKNDTPTYSMDSKGIINRRSRRVFPTEKRVVIHLVTHGGTMEEKHGYEETPVEHHRSITTAKRHAYIKHDFFINQMPDGYLPVHDGTDDAIKALASLSLEQWSKDTIEFYFNKFCIDVEHFNAWCKDQKFKLLPSMKVNSDDRSLLPVAKKKEAQKAYDALCKKRGTRKPPPFDQDWNELEDDMKKQVRKLVFTKIRNACTSLDHKKGGRPRKAKK